MPTCDELATKAELQELRDQLNAVLGKKEDGGAVQVFEKGLSPGAIGTVMLGTTFVATQDRAANAIMDIILSNPSESSIWQGLKSGAQKIEKVAGNGVKTVSQGLTKVGNLLGKSVAATATTAKAAGAAASTTGLLGDLVVLGGTLAINIGTVHVLDKRIQAESEGAARAFDAANYGMIKLYQKQQGDIDAVKSDLEANRRGVLLNKQQVEIIKTEITALENSNAQIQQDIDNLETQANITKAEIQAVRQEIDAFEIEVAEITAELKADIAKTESSVDKALGQIAQQKVLIDTAFEEIEYIKYEVSRLDTRISEVEIEIDELKAQFEELRADLEPQIELQGIRSKIQEARLIALEKKVTLAGTGGGAPVSLTQGSANAQNALLQLTNKLNATETNLQELTPEELANNPDIFKTQFNQLLQGVQTGTMDAEQLQQFRTNLNTDFSSTLNEKFGSDFSSKFNSISLAVAPAAISTAVQSGVCQSLNGGGTCPAVPGNPNTVNGLQGMNQGIQDAFNAMNTALGTQNLITGQNILGVVTNTNQAVRHASYGLEAMQNFASKAWEATHADKILNALSTAMVIHNGIMLSNNVLATIGEAANMTLQAMGIKKSDGTEYDVSQLVQTKVTQMLQNILGAENYEALTTRIAKYSRIYQASANVLNIVNDIADSARSTAELTCENTGKIGNALLESGVVYENAYTEMVEKVNPHSKAMKRLERFREGLEVIEQGASAVSEISSNVVETKENFEELKDAKNEWKTANEALIQEKKTQKEETKVESQAETNVSRNDFSRDESEGNN